MMPSLSDEVSYDEGRGNEGYKTPEFRDQGEPLAICESHLVDALVFG
jgi:hypothetical protein